jgi:hypothetical protein
MGWRQRWQELERAVRRGRVLEGPGIRLEETATGTRLSVELCGEPGASGGGGGVLLMRTVAAGTAPVVTADGFGAGVAAPPTVTGAAVRLANVLAGEAVAAGSWLLAVRAGEEWVALLPVWH